MTRLSRIVFPVAHQPMTKPMFVLGIGFTGAVVGLLLLSYQSLRTGDASARALAERRAEVMLGLLAGALDRDMKAAQVSVLLPFRPQGDLLDEPDELRDLFARAFARFSYPESFFVWRNGTDGPPAFYVFDRTERPPRWHEGQKTATPYPAQLVEYPVTHPFVRVLLTQTTTNSRYVVFDTILNEEPYHIIAKVLSAPNGEAASLIGFTINLNWVREQYFRDVAAAVIRVRDATDTASIQIRDHAGTLVADVGPKASDWVTLERTLSPLFVDPSVFALTSSLPSWRPWTATVNVAGEGPPIGATLGTRATYIFLASTALASLVGMFLTARAVRARATLAEQHSDFISTVTHELKTPLASIRLMGETLSEGRFSSVESIRDYAGLLSQEAWRLTRLINNLLAYASLSNARRSFHEPHEIAELVDDVLKHFHPQLEAEAFDVTIEIPPDLPRVYGDRTMLINALENVVDNAIKYSGPQRALSIKCSRERDALAIEIIDCGYGIEPKELPRVCEKFFRGHAAQSSGSGLGLAIVKRVVEEHHGTLHIASAPAAGTTVRLVLPAFISHG
jgi:two-component system phosphate regulon sensor histidine kinase PhoR